MKLFKNISMFMVAASLAYAAGAYTGNWFYPNQRMLQFEKYQAENAQKNTQNTESGEKGAQSLSEERSLESAQYAAAQEDRLSADTVYIVEEYDLGLKTYEEVTERLPAKYIGMGFDAFVEAVAEYKDAPSVADLEKGFLSLAVVSFSPEKVVVRKTYETSKNRRFCLVAEDHYVVVYYDDRSTLFMHTDIALSALPKELQDEILRVKYITGEGELYNFLESYSS